MSESLSKGWQLFNKLHGEHNGAAMIAALADICPDYADITADFGFGQIFSRDGLDMKTRELEVIALCTALGDMPGQLKAHLEAALVCGATKQECVESILQTCLYAGFARVTNALLVAKEVLVD
jgi:4-carboxymuconolactone decarboxylase